MIEKYLDKAMTRVKNGEEISTVVLSYPEKIRAELVAELQIASIAFSIQTRTAPKPIRRKLYLRTVRQKQNIFAAFFESYRIYAGSVAVVVILIASTAYAAANSLPGDKLFVLKKAYESAQLNLQLRLTSNPASKANLALNFANASLQDVQQVLSDPSDSGNQQQALEEANTQTQVAINSIRQNSNPAILRDPSVLNNLKNLVKTQNNLVAQMPASQASSSEVQTAKQSAGELQNLIAAATGSQSSSLPADTTIDITGTVTALTANTITVDKNTYNFEPEGLTVLDKANSKITISTLQVGENIRVQGIIQNNQNIAQSITINSIPQTSGAGSATGSNTGNSNNSGDNNGDQNAVSEPAKPNDVIGTFIPEPANIP